MKKIENALARLLGAKPFTPLGSIPSNAHGESIVQTNDPILGIVRLRHRR